MSTKPPNIENWATILPASSETIRKWSIHLVGERRGVVSSSRLLDDRGRGFDEQGLFSQRIFGPIHDYLCACGKYDSQMAYNVVCEDCGVVVRMRQIRCVRFGSIDLRLPIVHPWWYGGSGRPVEVLTGLSVDEVAAVISRDLAIDFGDWAANLDYKLVETRTGEPPPPDVLIRRQSGAEAIRHLLWLLHGEQLERRLREQLESGQPMPASAGRRLRLISSLVRNKVRPEDLVLEVIPVIPAGLRQIDLDEQGKIMVDAATHCYQRILALNRSIGRLLDKAPLDCSDPDSFPIRPVRGLERRMREAVSRLFAELLASGSPLERVSRRLRRRANLPQRRRWRRREPITSARAAVVPDPSLRLDECRIPRDVARKLWEPRIVSSIRYQGRTYEKAADYAKQRHWLAEYILDVLYDKKQTLLAFPPVDRPERVSAFQTRRTDDNAIHVHPLLAAWLELAFDGDQAFAWHTHGISSNDDLQRLNPSTSVRDIAAGGVQLALAGDALLGCYLATWEPNEQRYLRDDAFRRNSHLLSSPPMCASADEVRMAYETGKCGLQTPVVWKLPRDQAIIDYSCDTPVQRQGPAALCTTAGRAMLNDLLPATLPFIDVPLGRKEAEFVIAHTLEYEGPQAAMRLVERLAQFGLEVLTRSGASLALADLRPPPSKPKHLAEARKQILKTQKHYERGIICRAEADNKSFDIWLQATADIGADLIRELDENPAQLLRVIAQINPEVGQQQLQNLSGMVGTFRGSSHGYPIIPITGCFAEGLQSHEYFHLARRARGERVDEVLKRRDAHRLTHRLTSVARNVVVTEADCGTCEGVVKQAPGIEDRFARPLSELIAGRFSCETIVNPYTEETIAAQAKLITPPAARQIESLGIDRLEVRSPLNCQSKRGVCQACYGADPRTGELAALGTTVGALAALAIGRLLPKLRVFFTRFVGPPVHRNSDEDPRAKHRGTVSLQRLDLAVNPEGKRVALSAGVIEIVDAKQRILEQFDVPQGAEILQAAGAYVSAGDKLATWHPAAVSIYAKAAGTVMLDDLVPGRNMQLDQQAGQRGVWQVHTWQHNKHPCVRVEDIAGKTVDSCFLPKNSQIFALPDQTVDRGTLLAKVPTMQQKTGEWIVGGIPRVDELLSAREPERAAVLAEVDGLVEPATLQANRRTTIWVHLTDAAGNTVGDSIAHEIDLQRTGRILVRNRDRVAAGDCLTSGEPSPHDLLRILGRAAAGEYLLAELQKCFRGQFPRLDLDDRHLELILSRMLGFARVDTPGDTGLETGEILWRPSILALNNRLRRFLKIEVQGDSFMPPGRLVSRYQFDHEVRRVEKEGGQLPTYTIPWLAGARALLKDIDVVALRRSSFLTAEGFAMSLRSLAIAALTGRRQNLSNVKDCIVTGELMPAGSGWRNAEDHGESDEESQP